MKIDLTLHRIPQPDCTLGLMVHNDSGFRCHTVELPYKDNQTDISCIPPGVYECFKRDSPSNGKVFQLKNVIGRKYIQCHAGNSIYDILGCIVVGDSVGDINGDKVPDVLNSGKTLGKLLALLPETFLLEIK